MPQYWEQAGAKTQLQVGTAWPPNGGRAYAGNLNSLSSWVASPFVSHNWYTAAFDESGGLYTSGLNSCSALVYLFGPPGAGVSHGALWHVNCSVYSNDHTPAAALQAIGIGGLELKFVVIGFNKITQGTDMSAETRRSVVTFGNFIGQHAEGVDPWIYVGDSDMFGVSKEGFVGIPMRLATDNVSPRRGSVSGAGASGSSGGDGAPAGCCSRCYITTAICRSLGRGDDCAELRRLRWFRDEVLARSVGGPTEIAQYYATAPDIVAAIDAGDTAEAVYLELYQMDLLPALAAIGRGEFERARALYRGMCLRLQARYL